MDKQTNTRTNNQIKREAKLTFDLGYCEKHCHHIPVFGGQCTDLDFIDQKATQTR